MAFNKVKLSQVIKDFIITLDGDDYASNASDTAIRNFALRGIREIGFDLGKRIKSIKLSVNSNNTVDLPDDFVDMSKIGVVDSDGIVRVFGNNKNINYSRKYETGTTGDDASQTFDAGPLNISSNRITDREDDKTSTTQSASSEDDLDVYIFENYLYQGGLGRL